MEKANIPKIRFDKFNDDWEQRKLGEMATSFEYGLNVAAKEYDGENKYIRITDIDDNTHEFLTENLTSPDDDLTDAENYKLAKGDILFARTGASVGKSYIYRDSDGLVYYAGFLIRARIKEEYDVEFVFQNTLTDRYRKYIAVTSQRSGQPGVNAQEYSKFEIQVPEKEEQIKIGCYFRALDNLITLHQRKYEKLQMIKKSMLEKMFPQNGEKKPEIRFEGFTDDWEQRKLGDLVINHNAGIYISKEDYGTGTNVIGVGNIYDNDIFDGEIYRLGPVNDEKFLLEENDLIYGESSLVPEGIARTVCVGKNGVGSAFAWHTRRVKLDQSVINSHFATLELNYNIDVRKYLISVSTQTALTGMTTEGYFGVTLSLPTVEEQAHISSLFKQLDHLITLHQRKLEKLRNIKKSMLEKMFV